MRKGDTRLVGNQIKLGLLKSLRARVVSLLSMIAGSVMLVGGFLLILVDFTVAESGTLRNIALSAIQTFEQVIGFPLPLYEFANNSLSAIGIATCIIGFDLLMVSFGLLVQSKMARWIAIVIFALAAFFDFSLFLLQGVLGAPVSLPGSFINGLIVYILMKDQKWFTKELTANF
jgi:lysylphosphatidylglycerol synthetase-like protein (DUF2156 family)